jgi:hypothetical protein
VNARVDSIVHMMLTAVLLCSRPRIRRSVVLLKKFGETPSADFTRYSVRVGLGGGFQLLRC